MVGWLTKRYKHKHIAFSLIEILVVVSILAIVAVTAFTQYQAYTIRAKIEQAMVVFENIGELSKTFYDINGYFPNLQQIGLYYDPSDPNQSPMANTLSDYIAKYIPYTFLQDEGNAYTCPSAGYGGYISNLSAGDYITVTQNGSVITVNMLLVIVNKTYMHYCQFYYYQYDPTSMSMNSVLGDLIPSCENGADDPLNASYYFQNAADQC